MATNQINPIDHRCGYQEVAKITIKTVIINQ
jgi:hypothetical protein